MKKAAQSVAPCHVHRLWTSPALDCWPNSGALAFEHRIKAVSELPITIPNEKPNLLGVGR
jgi:hypothetical protein